MNGFSKLLSHSNNRTNDCQWAFLGCVDYQKAWDFQHNMVKARTAGSVGDTILLLEHYPVYTLGRRSNREHLLLTEEDLRSEGAQIIDVDRGGEITFHGPGQLIGYPIIDLHGRGGPLRYVRDLETVLINALGTLGVPTYRLPGLTGVWANDSKVAAIGVKINRGITSHGFAINVEMDLKWFDNIVPCGIQDKNITSLTQLLGRPVPLKKVADVIVNHFGKVFDFCMRETSQDVILSNIDSDKQLYLNEPD